MNQIPEPEAQSDKDTSKAPSKFGQLSNSALKTGPRSVKSNGSQKSFYSTATTEVAFSNYDYPV